MIESWKSRLNIGSEAGITRVSLFEHFVSLILGLLLVRLKAYNIDNNSVNFTRSYLKKKKDFNVVK